eukprot:scaffold47446_cov48-Phaeocystis_antarctica.AAC.1
MELRIDHPCAPGARAGARGGVGGAPRAISRIARLGPRRASHPRAYVFARSKHRFNRGHRVSCHLRENRPLSSTRTIIHYNVSGVSGPGGVKLEPHWHAQCVATCENRSAEVVAGSPQPVRRPAGAVSFPPHTHRA